MVVCGGIESMSCITPYARFVAHAVVGVPPAYMGIGPIPAVKKLLAIAGSSVNDFDVIELNEALSESLVWTECA